jgi:hypothetical protein
MNTGCPLIGVCLPSFLGKAGAGRQSGRDEIDGVKPDGVDTFVLDLLHARKTPKNKKFYQFDMIIILKIFS